MPAVCSAVLSQIVTTYLPLCRDSMKKLQGVNSILALALRPTSMYDRHTHCMSRVTQASIHSRLPYRKACTESGSLEADPHTQLFCPTGGISCPGFTHAHCCTIHSPGSRIPDLRAHPVLHSLQEYLNNYAGNSALFSQQTAVHSSCVQASSAPPWPPTPHRWAVLLGSTVPTRLSPQSRASLAWAVGHSTP